MSAESPGFSTRRYSATARSGESMWWSESFECTRSNHHIVERKSLAVRDAERETGAVSPHKRRRVDRNDIARPLPEKSCDAAVAAADVQKRLRAEMHTPSLSMQRKR